jgi:hypothetical protein
LCFFFFFFFVLRFFARRLSLFANDWEKASQSEMNDLYNAFDYLKEEFNQFA